ncbi:fasciclin-like arabinogalactan protein 2 [Triticum dicoccoides]|uniref:fasciclin-like arabinogalactan protein 2 n=1 Tax=Triticum dicoccoides TaxID=85692 RepID=UPI00188F66EE|nr:fasciclin-like arabinogalactan protein 2 [Triticum dicoccoides]
MQFAGAILLLLLLVPCAEGQPPEATPAGGLAIEQILSKNGCGAFAGLVAATAGVGQALREQGDAGLTVFCPDDGAVAAFAPRFSSLTAAGQAALLLHHGLAARSAELERLLTHGHRHIEVRTLDGGRWGYGVVTIWYYGGAMELSSSPPSLTTPVEARVTSTVVYNDRLTVYLIDAVLVPGPPALFDYSDTLVTICVMLGLWMLVLGSCGAICS